MKHSSYMIFAKSSACTHAELADRVTNQPQWLKSSSSSIAAAEAFLASPESSSMRMASSSSGAPAVGDGAKHDNDQEPVVESLDQIMVEREWNRLILRGPQPPPRYKHAAVSVGRKMFVTGGASPERTPNDVQMFHAEKLTWESLSCRFLSPDVKPTKGVQPETRCPSCTGHNPVFWDKQFVVVGCQTKLESKVVRVISLDVGSRSWSTLSPKGNAPVARTGHTVVRMAYRLVLFGGEDMKGRALNDIYILDLKSLLWLPLETSGVKPSPRSDHCAASYSERYMWIFGGKLRSTYYSDIYCLDFQKMEWTKGRSGPMARAGSSGVVVGSWWYIIGGEYREHELRKMLAFNLDFHEWLEVTNIRPGSPLANDGISLVRIQSKGRTFAVAFGGHDANLSNQIYVMLLPSKNDLGSPLGTTSDVSGQSGSYDSAFSPHPATVLSPPSVRTSDDSSGDSMRNTPESETFSLKDALHRYRESSAISVDDQEAKVGGNEERILASHDPSTSTTANDNDASYRIHESIHDERQGFIVHKDNQPNLQNGVHEPVINAELNERLVAALKLNEDLQNKLLQSHSASVDFENRLIEMTTENDDLEQQVLDLYNSKAEEEWKLEGLQRKLEEMERKLNSSSQPREDAQSGFTSTEKERFAKSNSLTTLFEDSAFGEETYTSNETKRLLEDVEGKLAAEVNSHILTQSKLKTATREKRELIERAANATKKMEDARADCKALRDRNVRLEQNLIAVKALLTETNEELQNKQLELAQATTRNVELQVEMHELSQKFTGS